MITVDPRGIPTREWIDVTADNLARFVPVMKVESGNEWRAWGMHVRQTLRLRGILIPVPDQFPTWEEWAQRFNEVIASI